jgi:prophage regulatory protein
MRTEAQRSKSEAMERVARILHNRLGDIAAALSWLDIEAIVEAVLKAHVRKIANPRIVGVKEAAELFGVTRSNFVRDYVKRPTFPKPLGNLACGPVWLRADIDGFKEDFDRGWLEK